MSLRSSTSSHRRGSAIAATAAPAFSIEEYKRKRKIALEASKKSHQQRPPTTSSGVNSTGSRSTDSNASASSHTLSSGIKQSRARSNSSVSGAVSALHKTALRAAPTYSKAQKQYLDFCVDKFVDPDMKLLSAIRERGFLLKLDPFGEDELAAHMDFLHKHTSYRQICVSLGSVEIKRDLRNKFDRLGIKRGAAFTESGAASTIKSVSAAALKTQHLVRLEVVGVRIAPELAPLLAKAIVHCTQLEFVSFAHTRLGDAGIEAVAVALGKCPSLQQLCLAACHLTDKARDHIAKIITLHGVLKDESVWSSSLRGERVGSVAARPALLFDLSQNALGDAAADAISDALYHDKWLLGLNVSRNRIARAGVARLTDTLTQTNRTLAVLLVNDMKEPADQTSIRRLETLMHDRKALLQPLAFAPRDKRLLLCSVLLEWGVSRELVLEICQGSDRQDAASQSGASSLGSSLSNDPHRRHRDGDASVARSSNQDDESDDEKRLESSDDDDDNQSEGSRRLGSHQHQRVLLHPTKTNASRSPQRIVTYKHALRHIDDRGVSASEAHMAHLQTIKLLTERMSAMEDEQRSARAYMNRLEAENQQLRSQLQASSGMSPSEERIIARLEDTISSLAHQVGELALESDTTGNAIGDAHHASHSDAQTL